MVFRGKIWSFLQKTDEFSILEFLLLISFRVFFSATCEKKGFTLKKEENFRLDFAGSTFEDVFWGGVAAAGFSISSMRRPSTRNSQAVVAPPIVTKLKY